MKPETKSIAEASVQELRDFAQTALGLEIEGTENRNVVLSRLREAGYDPDNEKFRIAILTRPEPAPTHMRDGSTEERDGRIYKRMTIHAGPGEGGDRPVPVRVNGKTMLIPRGQPCMVPEEYAEAVVNAQETTYEMTGTGIMNPREVPSYPHAVG